MFLYLCFLFLVVLFDSEGVVIDGLDDIGVYLIFLIIIVRSLYFEWLLWRNKEKEIGGDKMRILFFVDFLDEFLIENGGKEFRKLFFDVLLSEFLFDNGFVKVVMEI